MIVSRETLGVGKAMSHQGVTKQQSRGHTIPRTEVDPGFYCTQKDIHFEKPKHNYLEAAFSLSFMAHYRLPQHLQSSTINTVALNTNNCIPCTTYRPQISSKNPFLLVDEKISMNQRRCQILSQRLLSSSSYSLFSEISLHENDPCPPKEKWEESRT